jgi:hypothetical protein
MPANNVFMRILQLCFVSNLWPPDYDVTSIDIKTGSNVLDLPPDYGKGFDLIVAAPPCDQFTKTNALRWSKYPDYFINVAKACFDICIASGKPWIYENPPGRIEKFIPDLSRSRIITWHGNVTNKEYVVYSNLLLLFQQAKRYGRPGTINNYTKARRELWQPDFFEALFNALELLGLSSTCRTQIL